MRRLGAAGAGVVLGVWGLVSSCGCQAVSIAEPEVDGIAGAVVGIIEGLYVAEGRGRILFVGGKEDVEELLQDTGLAGVRQILARRLGVKVLDESRACRDRLDVPPLTPVECQTGEIGISVFVGPVREVGEDSYVLTAGFARSGLDGAIYEYTLRWTDGGWVIDDARLVGVA